MTQKHTRRGETQHVVKNQVILNWIQDLQRGWLSFVNSVRGRLQIKFAMTSLCNNGGFTLIELLVVVLIIGILAAIALPQYQLAVEKARAVQMLPFMRATYNALALYKLRTGSYRKGNDGLPSWNDLEIKPSSGFKTYDNSTDYENEQWYCFPNEEGTGYVHCDRQDSQRQNLYILFMFQPDDEPYSEFAGKRVCVANTDFGTKVCKALGGKKLPDDLWGVDAYEF